MFGGARVGIVNFDKNTCPYRLQSSWRHSVRGKLEKDTGIAMACAKPTLGRLNRRVRNIHGDFTPDIGKKFTIKSPTTVYIGFCD